MEGVQKRVIEMVKDLERKTYDEWLKSIGLFSLKKRGLRGGFSADYNFLKGGSRD